jgi:hypothetical protein
MRREDEEEADKILKKPTLTPTPTIFPLSPPTGLNLL